MKIILVYKNKQINNPRVFEKLKQTDQYFLRLSIARNASKFIHLVIESPIIDIVQENSTDKIIPTVQQAFENKKKKECKFKRIIRGARKQRCMVLVTGANRNAYHKSHSWQNESKFHGL